MKISNFFAKIAEAQGGTISFTNPISANSIEDLIAAVLNFVATLGSVVVVMMVIYSGFLFVKAQGEPAGLEKAKKTFFWTVIGGVVLIGAATFAAVIKSVSDGLRTGIL